MDAVSGQTIQNVPTFWSRTLSLSPPEHVGSVAVTKHTQSATKGGGEGITSNVKYFLNKILTLFI